MDLVLVNPFTTIRSSSLCKLHSLTPQLCPIPTVKPRVLLPQFPATIKSKPMKIALTRITAIVGGGAQDQKWTREGLITESLSNGMFKVRVDNGDVILGHVSGKMRQNHILILPGDKVKIEVSRYDSSRGRITYRVRDERRTGGKNDGKKKKK